MFLLRLFVLLSYSIIAYSQTADQKGLDIAIESDLRFSGWESYEVHLTMELLNKNGLKSSRRLFFQSIETANDGDKSLLYFVNPKDIKGTSVLTYSHKVGNDDQWLYLPALKRVKRISANNKSGPFMGSEFAYEDLSHTEITRYKYRWVRDDQYKGMDCYIVERDPVDKNSGYKRQEVWYDKEDYRIVKIVFYDRKNAMLKTLTTDDYKLYKGKYWRAKTVTIDNHQNGKSTTLYYSDFKFMTGLNPGDFQVTKLKLRR